MRVEVALVVGVVPADLEFLQTGDLKIEDLVNFRDDPFLHRLGEPLDHLRVPDLMVAPGLLFIIEISPGGAITAEAAARVTSGLVKVDQGRAEFRIQRPRDIENRRVNPGDDGVLSVERLYQGKKAGLETLLFLVCDVGDLPVGVAEKDAPRPRGGRVRAVKVGDAMVLIGEKRIGELQHGGDLRVLLHRPVADREDMAEIGRLARKLVQVT